ncbi:MAG: hypothetical protein ACLT8E_10565 [Akkermansia sp.]
MVPGETAGKLLLGVRQALVNNAAMEIDRNRLMSSISMATYVKCPTGAPSGCHSCTTAAHAAAAAPCSGKTLELTGFIFYPVQVFQPPKLAGQDGLPRQAP